MTSKAAYNKDMSRTERPSPLTRKERISGAADQAIAIIFFIAGTLLAIWAIGTAITNILG
jgi:hypothetical protein